MKYTKPALTISDQVQRLCERGMQGDQALMAERLGVKPKLPIKDDRWHRPVAIDNQRVFAILTICKFCLDRLAPQSHWDDRLHDLLNRFSDIPRGDMGMPENWLDCPIWA